MNLKEFVDDQVKALKLSKKDSKKYVKRGEISKTPSISNIQTSTLKETKEFSNADQFQDSDGISQISVDDSNTKAQPKKFSLSEISALIDCIPESIGEFRCHVHPKDVIIGICFHFYIHFL